ncbi:MAG: amidase, partial [Pseudomonadota bacterium]
QRLLDAGAICHAKTTTPEFCILGVTHSKLHGITRNPWDQERTCGGSSGGSAALLALGATQLATGSDIGGSIRIPASCCGISGYKPPYGRNPEASPWNLNYYSHTGPLARNVIDLALMQNIISGQSDDDLTSVREKVEIFSHTLQSLKGIKIAFSYDLGFFDVSLDVIDVFDQYLAHLRDLGAETIEVDLKWPKQFLQIGELFLIETIYPHLTDFKKHLDDLCESTKHIIAMSAYSDSCDVARANICANQMYHGMLQSIKGCNALICPTLSSLPVGADRIPPIIEFEIEGERKQIFDESWCMTVPFNMLSRCPVMAIPAGLSKDKIPVGVQIVGRSYMDQTVFEIAICSQKSRSLFVSSRDPAILPMS